MNVLVVEDYPSDTMLIEMEVREELPEARFQVVRTRPDFLAALEILALVQLNGMLRRMQNFNLKNQSLNSMPIDL